MGNRWGTLELEYIKEKNGAIPQFEDVLFVLFFYFILLADCNFQHKFQILVLQSSNLMSFALKCKLFFSFWSLPCSPPIVKTTFSFPAPQHQKVTNNNKEKLTELKKIVAFPQIINVLVTYYWPFYPECIFSHYSATSISHLVRENKYEITMTHDTILVALLHGYTIVQYFLSAICVMYQRF